MTDKKKPRCPNCGKRKIDVKISSRKNYTHGRKSNPIHTIKKVTFICTHVLFVDNRKIPCTYKETVMKSPPMGYISDLLFKSSRDQH